jgi:hypothetical protein
LQFIATYQRTLRAFFVLFYKRKSVKDDGTNKYKVRLSKLKRDVLQALNAIKILLADLNTMYAAVQRDNPRQKVKPNVLRV